MTVRIIDVSHHQGPIDFAKVKASGVAGVYMKATEGTSFKDGYFAQNWDAAKRVGLVTGGYHFARPSGNAVHQAEAFWEALGPRWHLHDLPPVLDYEVAPASQNWAQTFLDRIAGITKTTPVFYSYSAFIGRNFNTLGRFKLWLANYKGNPNMPPPLSSAPAASPWGVPNLWQYTSGATIPGVSGRCDVSVTDDLHFLDLLDIRSPLPTKPTSGGGRVADQRDIDMHGAISRFEVHMLRMRDLLRAHGVEINLRSEPHTDSPDTIDQNLNAVARLDPEFDELDAALTAYFVGR